MARAAKPSLSHLASYPIPFPSHIPVPFSPQCHPKKEDHILCRSTRVVDGISESSPKSERITFVSGSEQFYVVYSGGCSVVVVGEGHTK